MTTTYIADLRSGRMQLVIDRVDIGTAGSLEICSADYATVLATITLQKPSFVEEDAVITLQGTPLTDPDADNSGEAAIARIRASNGDIVIRGLSVGTGEQNEIVVNTTTVVQHQAYTVSAGTITHSNNTDE